MHKQVVLTIYSSKLINPLLMTLSVKQPQLHRVSYILIRQQFNSSQKQVIPWKISSYSKLKLLWGSCYWPFTLEHFIMKLSTLYCLRVQELVVYASFSCKWMFSATCHSKGQITPLEVASCGVAGWETRWQRRNSEQFSDNGLMDKVRYPKNKFHRALWDISFNKTWWILYISKINCATL